MASDRWGIAAGIVLVALFLGAAVLNAMPSAMGWSASPREVAVTAVALIAWPVYGAWMGWRRGAPARPWRFPVVFWSTVVFVAVGGLFALTVDGPLAFPGVLALVFSTAPFYGLTGLTGIHEPVFVVSAVIVASAVVLGVSVLAQVLSRRASTRRHRNAP